MWEFANLESRGVGPSYIIPGTTRQALWTLGVTGMLIDAEIVLNSPLHGGAEWGSAGRTGSSMSTLANPPNMR